MIDLDMLKLQAVKTGLGIKYLSKEEKISILLIQLNEIFPDAVVLKGGTALNRGYLHPIQRGRFSEDIDLDYCKHKSLDDKIKHTKTAMKKINEFNVLPPRILHRTLRFDCLYVNQLDEKDRVQVEFYLSEKKPAKPPQQILLQSQYIPVSATLFPVYSLEDLLGQKLIALYGRKEGKDIYDLSNLFIHYHISLEYPDFIQELIRKLDEMLSNSYYIGNATNHFIPRNLRPDWNIFIRMLKEKIIQRL